CRVVDALPHRARAVAHSSRLVPYEGSAYRVHQAARPKSLEGTVLHGPARMGLSSPSVGPNGPSMNLRGNSRQTPGCSHADSPSTDVTFHEKSIRSPLHAQPRQHLVGDDGCLLLAQPVELDVVLLLPHVDSHCEDQTRLAAGGEQDGDTLRPVHVRAGGMLRGSQLVRTRPGQAVAGDRTDVAAALVASARAGLPLLALPQPRGNARDEPSESELLPVLGHLGRLD